MIQFFLYESRESILHSSILGQTPEMGAGAIPGGMGSSPSMAGRHPPFIPLPPFLMPVIPPPMPPPNFQVTFFYFIIILIIKKQDLCVCTEGSL